VKALILAAGRGTRMEELSGTENKCMLRLHGKRLIEYSLENAASIEEISEIVIVVGYRADSIMGAYSDEFRDKPITYVLQREQRGVVNAMECASGEVGPGPFFLFLADEVTLGGRHREMIRLFEEEELFCACGVHPQKDASIISRTYTLRHGPDDRIYQLVEKPKQPFNHLMGTGNILFRSEIFNYVDSTPVNPNRGEKELPDLIQCAIDDGRVVKLFNVCDHYININSREEWRQVENCWHRG